MRFQHQETGCGWGGGWGGGLSFPLFHQPFPQCDTHLMDSFVVGMTYQYLPINSCLTLSARQRQAGVIRMLMKSHIRQKIYMKKITKMKRCLKKGKNRG